MEIGNVLPTTCINCVYYMQLPIRFCSEFGSMAYNVGPLIVPLIVLASPPQFVCMYSAFILPKCQ